MDTPGFMVGPKAEETALVRHVSRMFVAAASLSVPYFTVVLRRGYGLGAQAMAGGHFHAPFFNVSWPAGEFGGMNLEGAVRIGMRRQLEATLDPKAREELAQSLIAEAHRRGTALNVASLLELDRHRSGRDARLDPARAAVGAAGARGAEALRGYVVAATATYSRLALCQILPRPTGAAG